MDELNEIMHLKQRFCLVPVIGAYAVFLFLLSTPVFPGSAPSMAWTAADMLPSDGGFSVCRYADYGLGEYPLRFSLPGAVTRIRIDGAPLYGLSPFGPDLDLIPAVFIDSLSFRQPGVISMRTWTGEPDEPVTTTDFFQGAKQRFRFQGTFAKKVSAQSSLFIGGSSSGIHGSRETEAAAFRSYLVKFRRSTEQNGELFLTARALRDRDGLRDIANKVHMGSRETDMVNLTAGVSGLPLTGRTTVTPVVYYQSGISRFARYGTRKSLDDDGFGFSCNTSSRYDTGVLSLSFTSDIRSIDSRLHGASWQRDDSRVTVLWNAPGNRFRYGVFGGILYSSHFGTGGNAGGEATVSVSQNIAFTIRGARTDEFPDAGMEVYPALAFGDSTATPRLGISRSGEFESGIEVTGETVSFGVFGFYSAGRLPVFNPETALCFIGDREVFSGARCFLTMDRDERFHVDFRAYYCNPGDSRHFSPYPEYECVSRAAAYRMFFGDKLKSSLYGAVRLSGWDGPMTPDKAALFLDMGASCTVANVSLFMNIFNITSENLSWFDTYGWQDINTVWGIRWSLRD